MSEGADYPGFIPTQFSAPAESPEFVPAPQDTGEQPSAPPEDTGEQAGKEFGWKNALLIGLIVILVIILIRMLRKYNSEGMKVNVPPSRYQVLTSVDMDKIPYSRAKFSPETEGDGIEGFVADGTEVTAIDLHQMLLTGERPTPPKVEKYTVKGPTIIK